jgi:hypothetical protein
MVSMAWVLFMEEAVCGGGEKEAVSGLEGVLQFDGVEGEKKKGERAENDHGGFFLVEMRNF